MERPITAPPEVSVTAQELEKFKSRGTGPNGETFNIDLTPEEKDAMHNAACLKAAESSMRAQNYLNYSSTKKLMPEPAMVSLIADTLTEAKAADQLARYDFGAMPLFLAKLKTLTFLEQVDLSRRVNNEIARWEGCKTALECISDMHITDSMNRQMMLINSMNHFGYNGTQEEFTADYTEKMDQLKKISAVLAACIDANKEGLGTTSFTTNEMIALMEKRASELQVESGTESSVKYANHVVEIFKNRTSFDFLKGRLEIFLKTNKKDLKRAISELKSNKMPKCMKTLVRIFGNDTMYRVWYTLIMNHINHDADAVFVLLSFLAKLTETEKNTGNAVWAKVFILNISDCQRKVFDLEDPDGYIGQIWELFHVPIDKFLHNNKLNSRINPGYSYTFKLDTPEEYVNAISDYEANHMLRWLQEYADERQAAIDAAMNAMKAQDGLDPNDNPIGDGVPDDHKAFVTAQMEDISRRAEAAGISMEEITSAMTPDQLEKVVTLAKPESFGGGKTQAYTYTADDTEPDPGDSDPESNDAESEDPPMSEKLQGMVIPDA